MHSKRQFFAALFPRLELVALVAAVGLLFLAHSFVEASVNIADRQHSDSSAIFRSNSNNVTGAFEVNNGSPTKTTTKHDDEESSPFPRVYSVRLPNVMPRSSASQLFKKQERQSDLDSVEMSGKERKEMVLRFLGEVDLLQVRDCSKKSMECQTWILVHSPNELDYLTKLLKRIPTEEHHTHCQGKNSDIIRCNRYIQPLDDTQSLSKSGNKALLNETDVPSFRQLAYERESTIRLHKRTSPIAESNESQTRQNLKEDNKSQRRKTSSSFSTIDSFPCYSDLNGTYTRMRDLVDLGETIPNLSVKMIDIGDSYLKTVQSNGNVTLETDDFSTETLLRESVSSLPEPGYDIYAIVVTGEGSNGATSSTTKTDATGNPSTKQKPVVFIISGVHPREYAAPEVLARWTTQLIERYKDGDASIVSLLDRVEVHTVWVVNPDGRYLAETSQPFRRKNLNPTAQGSLFCLSDEFGVDLNRNFPYQWGDLQGSSSSSCQQTYHGAYAVSEPETKAVVDYAYSIFPKQQRQYDVEQSANSGDDRTKYNYSGFELTEPYDERSTSGIFLDLHTFGKYIIYPWGYDEKDTPNSLGFQALVNKYAFFTGYDIYGPGSNYDGYASGATDDWSYAVLGAAGMTFEIGTDFHQPCTSNFETQVVEGNIKAFDYALSVSFAPYLLSKGPDIVESFVELTTPNQTDMWSMVTVVVQASDTAFSSQGHETSQQAIDKIRVYVDVHPYDISTIGDDQHNTVLPYLLMRTKDVSLNQTGSTVMGSIEMRLVDFLMSSSSFKSTTADDASHVVGLVPGRHVIYLEAVDVEGYVGPVSAAWLDVDGTQLLPSIPTQHPTTVGTSSPFDEEPTFSNDDNPTSLPEDSPTLAPSSERIVDTSDDSASSSCHSWFQVWLWPFAVSMVAAVLVTVGSL